MAPRSKRFPSHRRAKRDARNASTAAAGGLPRAMALWPPANESLASVTLAKRTTHPSVFRKRIRHIDGNPRVGDWVAVYHEDAAQGPPVLFAYGIYNPKSEVAVRLVRWSCELPDPSYWDHLIERAVTLRTETLGLDRVTTAYRVIHAEADGMPGLVVDRYADCLSAEVFSAAMAPRVAQIMERLADRLGTTHWLIQPSPHLQSQEGFALETSQSPHLPGEALIAEYGTRYCIHFGSGHKTGFFCDQRDNRRKLTEFSPGRTVLDVCCYTGGFAVAAAATGQAAEVTGIDLDEAPLKTARQNASLNRVRVKFTQADAFAYMRDMLRGGRQFDIVVLDPPKLIRNRSELDEGTRKHFDLNRLAMQLVRPGGLMLTCCCAGLLANDEFTRVVRAAARSAFLPSEFNPNPVARQMQFLARVGAAACHPVSANCPETEYLKAHWLRIA